jgi:hypothetical protein
MHYYDDVDWQQKNELQLVIYKHKDLTANPATYYYQVCSIQKCFLIEPKTLASLINGDDEFDKITKKLARRKADRFYMLYMKQSITGLFIIEDIEDVSDCVNNFLRIH